MIIKSFLCENFRNVKKCNLEFSPGVNLLFGDNAQGKTNIIEGIYLFSRGKSFRGRDDSELVRFSEDGFYLKLDYEKKNLKETLEYALFGKEKQRKKNGYKIERIREMIGSFNSVLFSPDDLLLVKESPEYRREFMNVAISQYSNAYISIYSNYKKALQNRNCLLKNIQKGMGYYAEELNSWSECLAEFAKDIYIERIRFTEKIEKWAKKVIEEISENKEDLKICYKSDVLINSSDKEEIKKEYVRIFCESQDREILAGTTLFGPHRDDIEILINGKSARNFASQGQQRSIVLALKMAEGEIIREMNGEYPVFLFDDVLSELDEGRQKYILSKKGEKQIIITACQKNEINDFADRIIEVKSGEYKVLK